MAVAWSVGFRIPLVWSRGIPVRRSTPGPKGSGGSARARMPPPFGSGRAHLQTSKRLDASRKLHLSRYLPGPMRRTPGPTLADFFRATLAAFLVCGVTVLPITPNDPRWTLWELPAHSAVLPACGGSDWPTYLGMVSRQGRSVGEVALSPATAGLLVPLWNFTTNGPVSASPAIVQGTVYIGSWDGYEYAINASTGKQLWRTFLGINTHGRNPIGVASSATVQAGRVY